MNLHRIARERIGISITVEVIHAVALVKDTCTWSCVQQRILDEPLAVAIKRLLTEHRPSRFFPGSVVIALSDSYCRVRVVHGVPANLSAGDVQELIETNRDRYFISPFTETATTSGRKLKDGGWEIAIVDAAVVRECFEGCKLSGYQLRAAVPARAALLAARERHMVPAVRDADAEDCTVIGAALYRPAWGLELVPDGITATQHASSRIRTRAAVGLFVIASAIAWLGPNARNLIVEHRALSRVELLRVSERGVEAKLDRLNEISDALTAITEEDHGSLGALAVLSELATVIPTDAVLHQVRMDSVAVEIALVVPDAVSVLKALAQYDASLVMVGMVTTEAPPGALQRVVLRFPRKKTANRKKRRRKVELRGGETESTAIAAVALVRFEALHRNAPDIQASLIARLERWRRLQDEMLTHGPVAVLVASASQSVKDLASECGVDLGQPTVIIDSSGVFMRLRSRASVKGDPEAIALLLQGIETHEPRFRTRSIQLTRAGSSPSASLSWSGTIEVESIVRPLRP